MKGPHVELGNLQDKKAWEYLVRFVFGGVVTACTGLATHAWGPIVGGLFLGFPSILPASLTLVKQHEGRAQAVQDAVGGRVGSIGLVAFAAVVWGASPVLSAVVVLVLATLAWLAVDVGLWFVRFGA